MADAYLQSLLGDSETIRSEARQHPMALLRFALQPILVFLGALVCLAIGMWLTPDGQGLFSDIVRWIDTLLGLLTAGLFILAIVWFPLQAFRWTKRRFMVTDRRVLYVDGVLRKNSVDAGLNMITDVGFRQGVLGRSLGYGDLVVATASNRPLQFRQMRDALAFKQAIMAAQHATVEARADEILVSKGLAPLSTAQTPGPTAAAATVAPTDPAPPPVPAWDGSDVPQMQEDDAPPSDPMIFGTPTEDRQDDESEAAGEPEEAAGEPEEAAGAAASIGAPQVEDDTPDLDALLAGDSAAGTRTPAEPAADAADAVGEAVEGPTEAADAADAVGEAVEGTVAGAADAVGEAVEGTVADAADAVGEAVEGTVADAADAVGEAVEGTVADAADAVGEAVEGPTEAGTSGGYLDALDGAESAMGGLVDDARGSGADSVTTAIARLAELRDTGAITAEEFETRKQELLDRI